MQLNCETQKSQIPLLRWIASDFKESVNPPQRIFAFLTQAREQDLFAPTIAFLKFLSLSRPFSLADRQPSEKERLVNRCLWL